MHIPALGVPRLCPPNEGGEPVFGAVFAVGVAVMTRGARLQAAGPAVETLVSPRPVGRARSRAGDTAAGRRKAQTRDGEEEKTGRRRRGKVSPIK